MEQHTEVTIICFVKFISEEHQNQFLDGNLFMRDLQYFIDSEEEQGRADNQEGSFVLNEAQLEIGEEKVEGLIRTRITSDFATKMPILCLFTIEDTMFIENKDDSSEWVINFDDGVLEHMKKHFGENVLLIQAKPFIERAKLACREQSIDLIYHFVRYFDYSKDSMDRINFTKDIFNPKIAFAKSEYFQAQNEFRFAFPSEEIDKELEIPNFTLDIGDLRDITTNIHADELLRFKLKFDIAEL